MTAKRCKCGEIPEIEASRFEHIGKDQGEMEQITRPNLSYWQDAWRRIKKNKVAFCSLLLILLYALLAIFAPMFSQYGFAEVDSSHMNEFFSAKHWL